MKDWSITLHFDTLAVSIGDRWVGFIPEGIIGPAPTDVTFIESKECEPVDLHVYQTFAVRSWRVPGTGHRIAVGTRNTPTFLDMSPLIDYLTEYNPNTPSPN